MTIELAVKTPADRALLDHLLVVFRGLRLSQDLELASAALRAERGVTEALESERLQPELGLDGGKRKEPAWAQ